MYYDDDDDVDDNNVRSQLSSGINKVFMSVSI